MELVNTLDLLLNGIISMLSFSDLFWVVIGAVFGTLIGSMPGLGPNTGVAVLLPLTFAMPSDSGILLLISIYLGCMYGGRISSILINAPGDAAAIMTCMDGYPLMQAGRGGVAMGISAFSSFIGGMIGIIFMTFFAPLLAKAALAFGPPEYFAVMIFSLIAISSVTEGSSRKGLIMVVFGLLLAMVGSDFVSGKARLTFGIPYMLDGIDFVPVAIGVFGLSEVLIGLEKSLSERVLNFSLKLSTLFPTPADIRESLRGTLTGSVVGLVVGILPGAGATLSTFAAYGAAKKVSKKPELFGKGSVEGIAAPEAANNACVAGALTPMLALGIPGSSVAALIMGGFIIHDLQPGPLMFVKTPDVAWGIIGGLYIANVVLLLVNTAMIPLFVATIRAAQPILYPLVGLLCVIGVYSVHGSMFDVWVMLIFGGLGFLMKKGGYPLAGLLLALILGPSIENTFRQSLIMANGDYGIFLTRPISLILVILTVLFLSYPLIKVQFAKKFKEA
ncbi:MAG: tripartite tricarboxylate transporter permease [Peptococcaceae bacterium]